MSKFNKITILGNKEKDYLMAKSAAVLPKNPSEQGWSAERILRTLHEPLQVIFKWLQQTQDQTNEEVNRITNDIDDILNEIEALQLRASALEETTNVTHVNRFVAIEQDISNIIQTATDLVTNLLSGATIVNKTKHDQEGNVIDDSYASKIGIGASTSPTDKKLTIRIYTPKQDRTQATPNLSSVTYTIDSATPSAAGLMSASDKVKLNNLNSAIDSLIGVHDTDNEAHLYIRQLIEALQKEIARLDAKGRSYGAIDLTQSQLLLQANISGYINNFLHNKYEGGYSPMANDLIYTKEVVGENVHEWEFNNDLGDWVDNGAWTIEKGSNTEYGIIKGDGTFINIVNGIVEVLRAKIADKVGFGLDFHTKQTIDDAFNARYTKEEVDNLLDQLKAIYGWESSELGQFNHEDKIYYDEIEVYDFLIVSFYSIDGVLLDSKPIYTKGIIDVDNIFCGTAGTNGILVPHKETLPDRSYLEFLNDGHDEGSYIKVYGVKMEQQKAENIVFEDTDVDTELKRLEGEKIDEDLTNYDEHHAVIENDIIPVYDTSEDKIKQVKVKNLMAFETDVIEYGVRWVVGQASPVGERVKRVNGELFVGAATNLVANVGIDEQVVANSFDNIAIFNTRPKVINGNVMIERELYFHKLEFTKEGDVDYEYSWVCERKLAGYIRPRIFIDDNGKEINFAYLGKYEASQDESGKMRSVPNVYPLVSVSRGNARKAARKNDGDGDNTNSRWGITDLAEYHYHIVVPFEIEFATRHCQNVLKGVSELSYSNNDVALVTEEDTNSIIIANSKANNFVVGQKVSIGTANSNSSVASQRDVISILNDTPNVGEATIVLSGEPFDVTEGNVISARAWVSGKTDNVVASSGAFTANNGQYPIVYRGYENPYGNIYTFIDGAKVVNHKLWVCEDRSAYDDKASVGGSYAAPFMAVAYLNAQNDGYVKELGYDKLFPYARLPVVAGGTGAGNAAYYADYYYQADGDRTLMVGGRWNASGYAGLYLWSPDSSLSTSNIYYGFRLSFRPLKGVN